MGIVLEAWTNARKEIKHLDIQTNFEIFQMDFWSITKKIKLDCEEGNKRKKKGGRVDIMLENLKTKYSLSNRCKILYTDGSKII